MVTLNEALIGLGANLAAGPQRFDEACAAICGHPQVTVTQRSGDYGSLPAGGPRQPGFLNAVARLATELDPAALLGWLQQVEADFGRQRVERWGPRTLDLDLLLFGELERNEPALQLPHPRLAVRRFVLRPAVDVAADWRHPLLAATLAALHDALADSLRYVAVCADDPQWARELARRASRQFAWQAVLANADARHAQSGPRPPAAIEFLPEAQRRLAAAVVDPRTVISDFWLPAWRGRPEAVDPPPSLVIFARSAARRSFVSEEVRDLLAQLGPQPSLFLAATPAEALVELDAARQAMTQPVRPWAEIAEDENWRQGTGGTDT